MNPFTRHAFWAVLSAGSVLLGPLVFGQALHDAATTGAPFIDILSVIRSLSPTAETYLKIGAAAVAGVAISTSVGSGAGPVWRRGAMIALIVLNPVFLYAGAHGAEALLLFSVSLITWRAVLSLADRQDYAAIVLLGGALAVAGAGSSYFLLTFPALFVGLLALSPWSLTLRGATGLSLAYWSPLVMIYLAYFYMTWITNERLPLLARFDFDARAVIDARHQILAAVLVAPTLLMQMVRPRQERRVKKRNSVFRKTDATAKEPTASGDFELSPDAVGSARRLAAAVIFASILVGGMFATGAGGDPLLFAVTAFAAQLAVAARDKDSPFIRGLAAAFVAGAILAALSIDPNLIDHVKARVVQLF